ncbi:MAG: pyruvate kinase [Gammaproteobacteria bacterium]|jgi:pyruvate kinase
MRRTRNAKIIATLGPASSSPEVIRQLFDAGADVFRINMSHGTQEDHRERVNIIRKIEEECGRPIAVLLDIQGPKLRVGHFRDDGTELHESQRFKLDLDEAAGTNERVCLPHPEIFAALQPGTNLLIDDGKVRLEVEECGPDYAITLVMAGGRVSNNKGVNVPGVVLPMSPFTDKDRSDLAFGLELGVDWVAPSFIQRPEDLVELKSIVGNKAFICSKLEKPAAVDCLDAIVELSDAVMVARGDLGVELPPEQVPAVQKRIIRACREAGKAVVVATQMLESMVNTPVPTRAEASDVAVAVYDGADAVMLSAESAAGKYPVEAVDMMHRIIHEVERDPAYRRSIDAQHPGPQPTPADAISDAMRRVVQALPIVATITYTSSGYSGFRTARERPDSPILGLTPLLSTARRMALIWGIHAAVSEQIHDVEEMVTNACRIALDEGLGEVGDLVVIVAGMPFGVSGTTNMLRIATIT